MTIRFVLFSLIFFIRAASSQEPHLQCSYGCGTSEDKRVFGVIRTFEGLIDQIQATSFKHVFNGMKFASNTFQVGKPEFSLLSNVSWPPLSRFSYSWKDSPHDFMTIKRNGEYGGMKRLFPYDEGYATVSNAFVLFDHDIQDCFVTYLDFLRLSCQRCENRIREIRLIIKREGNGYYDDDDDYAYRTGDIVTCEEDLARLNQLIDLLEQQRSVVTRLIERAREDVQTCYFGIYDACIKNHQSLKALYERGLLNYDQGKFFEALEDVFALIEKAGHLEENNLPVEAYFCKGVAESELGLYHEAIQSLNSVIEKKPELKDAYLERAIAYFETGQIESSLKDYLQSGVKVTPLGDVLGADNSDSRLEYATGLMQAGMAWGVLQGGIEGAIDFIPSLAHSASGLANGLISFALNPKQVSVEFISSCKECVKDLRENPSLLKECIPEIKELADRFDQLDEFQKGTLTGKIIGKYGISIFAVSKAAKGVQAYLNLKKANSALSFETLARSAVHESEALLQTSQTWRTQHNAAKAIKTAQLEKEVSDWLGEGTNLIRNSAGDSVFLSKDRLRKVRFDFNRPYPHESPHLHLQHFVDHEWREISRVYPIDVPHK
ncbi:MAG: tetratricopeptide repeat protein [Chlamydiales bacterium]|nr:tetratricopeptide repeat protein [Chlamydiales bacterium]